MNTSDVPQSFASQSSLQNLDSVPEVPPVSGAHPFETQYVSMPSRSFFHVIDAALKRPGQVLHELMQGTSAKVTWYLLLTLLACLLGVGLIMGSFSGGAQYWQAPLKIMFGTLIGGLICLPSLYILLCLCGGDQNVLQSGRILLFGLTLTGILLIGFVPVAWLFSQATESLAFIGTLYLVIWAISLFFGLRLMKSAFEFLSRKSLKVLRLWVVIFILVLLQMSTTLRPIIGPADSLQFDEKLFFALHWVDSLA